MDVSQVRYCWATTGTPKLGSFFKSSGISYLRPSMVSLDLQRNSNPSLELPGPTGSTSYPNFRLHLAPYCFSVLRKDVKYGANAPEEGDWGRLAFVVVPVGCAFEDKDHPSSGTQFPSSWWFGSLVASLIYFGLGMFVSFKDLRHTGIKIELHFLKPSAHFPGLCMPQDELFSRHLLKNTSPTECSGNIIEATIGKTDSFTNN